MKEIVKKLFPKSIKQAIKREIRILKTPAMVWGYTDSAGRYSPKTRVSDSSLLYHPENITIEDNVFVWHYTILDGTGGLNIKEGAQIGAWVGIFTHSSHISIRILGSEYQNIPEYSKPGYVMESVSIEKYVFVGAGSLIMPGVSVGKGALISAGSLVTKDVPAYSIVQGSPCKIVGDTRKIDEKYLVNDDVISWYNDWQK